MTSVKKNHKMVIQTKTKPSLPGLDLMFSEFDLLSTNVYENILDNETFLHRQLS